MLTTQNISKEEISGLLFPSEEILNTTEEQELRRTKLHRALSLGNLERTKVEIVFRDTVATKAVETTIWGVTDRDVILKGAITLPIRRIASVKIL